MAVAALGQTIAVALIGAFEDERGNRRFRLVEALRAAAEEVAGS